MEGPSMTYPHRHFLAGFLLGIIALLTIPNLIDASIQSYYAAADDAPIESTIATFWWHLTDY